MQERAVPWRMTRSVKHAQPARDVKQLVVRKHSVDRRGRDAVSREHGKNTAYNAVAVNRHFRTVARVGDLMFMHLDMAMGVVVQSRQTTAVIQMRVGNNHRINRIGIKWKGSMISLV